jgi:hypothetical protein
MCEKCASVTVIGKKKKKKKKKKRKRRSKKNSLVLLFLSDRNLINNSCAHRFQVTMAVRGKRNVHAYLQCSL